MAIDRYTNPYLDSSVFIAWIHKEKVDGVDRFQIANHIIKGAERGEYPIWISALTLAEVHKLPRGGHPALTKEQDEMIIQFFQNEYFKVLPIDRDLGETANRFCREYSIHGNDALHLACALRAKCDALLVWDRPLVKAVKRNDIHVLEPQILGQMLLLPVERSAAEHEPKKPNGDDDAEEAGKGPAAPEAPVDTAGVRRGDAGDSSNTAPAAQSDGKEAQPKGEVVTPQTEPAATSRTEPQPESKPEPPSKLSQS